MTARVSRRRIRAGPADRWRASSWTRRGRMWRWRRWADQMSRTCCAPPTRADSGMRWIPTLPTGAAHAVTGERAAGAVYVATDQGVFWAQADLDNAGTPNVNWTSLSDRLPPGMGATDVRLDAAGIQLYAAVDGYGVYATAAPHRQRSLRLVNAADFSTRAAAPGSLLSVIGGAGDGGARRQSGLPGAGRGGRCLADPGTVRGGGAQCHAGSGHRQWQRAAGHAGAARLAGHFRGARRHPDPARRRDRLAAGRPQSGAPWRTVAGLRHGARQGDSGLAGGPRGTGGQSAHGDGDDPRFRERGSGAGDARHAGRWLHRLLRDRSATAGNQ